MKSTSTSILTFLLVLTTLGINAQTLTELSLEELMDIDIVSASKSKEKIFEAPLSSSVLTQEEILKSGANSIPEALRLVPGIIVREQSNGNYDVHLRGFDNVPTESLYPLSSNSITLVMINNRIVYNHFAGGTFWETLPIGLNDIERIEVVRGASSPMYGPNAVAGVINIITKTYDDQTIIAEANLQGGSFETKVATANLGYNFENGLTAVVTGNFQQRDRTTTEYYQFFSDSYIDNYQELVTPSFGTPVSNLDERYPNPKNAVDKYGLNGFVTYDKDDLNIQVSAGYQESEVQKVYVDVGATALSTAISSTTYFDAKSNFKGVNTQVSYLNGTQNTLGIFGWEYDFNTLDLSLEYDWNLTDNLVVRPGLNYRSATYDGVFIGGQQNISAFAGSLYTSYFPTEKIRLVASGRIDNYNILDSYALSYQLTGSYNLSSKLFFRAGVSRAVRAPFILDSFVTHQIIVNDAFRVDFLGSTDMDLMSILNYEFGFRAKPLDNLFLDLEVFHAKTKNYSDLINTGIIMDGDVSVSVSQYQNLEESAAQTGATLSANLVLNKHLQLKTFVTIQQTQISNHRDSIAIDGTIFLKDLENEATPNAYGGFFANYNLNEKWNFNTTFYYYGNQKFRHIRGTDELNQKLILNAKVDYKILGQLSVFVNARNLLGTESREFAFADRTARMYLAGVSFNIK